MVRSRPRLTTALAATALGVYLLVLGGATAAITDAVRACSGWPTCQGAVTLENTALLVAWGHRITALLVGFGVLGTAVAALGSEADGRVKGAIAAALALYPVQIAVGAVVARSGAAGWLPAAHLAAGMGIFVSLVLALAWRLESETGTADDGRVLDPAEVRDGGGDGADSDRRHPQPTPAADPSTARRLRATAFAYFRLMKPRLMWLLCLVAAAGMALAAGPALTVRTIVLTLGGGVLSIGASGTFNHVLERDVDQRMSRTSDRPVATHRIPVRNALAFGGALTVLSLALFWQVNALAAALGLAAIVFYSVVYTLVLKPNTVQNTVIGGFAGALPAIIGWAAVTGEVGLPGLALAGVIFLWTPAHFYNLALAYKEDYARGGFPMMPVVRGETETRKHVLLYLGATLVAAGALAGLTALGVVYAATSAILGAVFLWAVVRLHREQTERAAFRAFHASNAYLGAVLLAIVVDALVL